MNKINRTIVLLVLGASCYYSNAQSRQNGHKAMDMEKQKVMEVITKMTTAFHKKDINGIMATYEPNAVVVFEPERPISDRMALKNKFIEAFTINPRFTFSGHEVFVTADSAIHLAPWTMSGTAPDGSSIEQSGLSVAVLRRQKDGNWLMIFDNPHGQFLMENK